MADSGHQQTASTISFADSAVSDSATLASPSAQSSAFTKYQEPEDVLLQSVRPSIDPASSIVPPEHPFRTLVLCFDGTGDQFVNRFATSIILLIYDRRFDADVGVL